MKFFKEEKGFTIMEIMIASFFTAVVVGSFFTFVRAQSANANMTYAKMTMQEQGMRAIQNMQMELRQTSPSRVTLGSGGSFITFQVPNGSNSVTASYGVNWAGAHSIQYSVANNQLIRVDSTATVYTATRKLCNFVQSAIFSIPTPGIVAITLNLQQTLENNRVITQSLSTEVDLRNP